MRVVCQAKTGHIMLYWLENDVVINKEGAVMSTWKRGLGCEVDSYYRLFAHTTPM